MNDIPPISEPLFFTLDNVPACDSDIVWVIRKPIVYGEPVSLLVFRTAYHLYKNKGYYFFSTKEAADQFMNDIKAKGMFLEFRNPVPVIVEGNKEAYAIYVRDGGQLENDIWCCVLCEGGHVRHYRSDQIRIHRNETFDISREKM